MKRYLVFAGQCFYASGGWNDFLSAHDDLAEAVQAAKVVIGKRLIKGIALGDWDCDETFDAEWYQVVDLVEGRVVDTNVNEYEIGILGGKPTIGVKD
jgi:hypothetical protein